MMLPVLVVVAVTSQRNKDGFSWSKRRIFICLMSCLGPRIMLDSLFGIVRDLRDMLLAPYALRIFVVGVG